MHLTISTKVVKHTFKGVHICQVSDQLESLPVIDIRQEMKDSVHDYIKNNSSGDGAYHLAVKIRNFFEAKYNGKIYFYLKCVSFLFILITFIGRALTMLSIDQIKTLINNIQHTELGSWEGRVKSAPLCFVTDDDSRLFLQFDLTYTPSDPNDGLQRMLGWAHPQLIFLLRSGPLNLFIDCTFHCVPRGFYQLMTLMVYSPSHRTYVPIFYVLLQTKYEDCYLRALYQIMAATGFQLKAKTVTCDFEFALINAVQEVFSDVPLIGCLFHFKQAIRRRLLKLKLPEEVITVLIGEHGLMNFITSIPVDDIGLYAIPYIRACMAEYEKIHKQALDEFWKYFFFTWMRRYDPKHWNIHAIEKAKVDPRDVIINRTNNASERYNRTLKNRFPCAHPSMIDFVCAIRNESHNYVQQLRFISEGKLQPVPHESVTLYPIPDDYTALRLKNEDESSSQDTTNNQPQPVVRTSVKRTLISSPVFEEDEEDDDCNSVSSNTSRSGRPIKMTKTLQGSGYSILPK